MSLHLLAFTSCFSRSSIGSASSLQCREDNANGEGDDAGSDHMDRLGLGGLGDLGIRRVSDISHINEIRREVR